MDYKTVQHHIGVFEKNNMITKIGEKCGVFYFLSNYLEVNIVVFNKIRTLVDKKSNLG